MNHLDNTHDAIPDGDAQTAQAETTIALEAKIGAETILKEACIPVRWSRFGGHRVKPLRVEP